MTVDVTREHLDKHVHSRLCSRVRIYLGISVVIVLVILYRLIFEGGNLLYPLVALAIGLVIGIVVSRMFSISWDKDREKVVSRMNIYGTAFLAAYVLFELAGEHFIRLWFSGPEVLTVILSLAGGAVLGRGIGMGRAMMRVLRENM
ncbi:MAG: hypothetical protein ACREGH_04170 [Minisyncoccia bacterium]